MIYDAWDDEPWVVEGAAVRVSLICFAGAGDAQRPAIHLDGQPVGEIYSDLAARRGVAGVDLTRAQCLAENLGVTFMGDTKGGAFDMIQATSRGNGFWPPSTLMGALTRTC